MFIIRECCQEDLPDLLELYTHLHYIANQERAFSSSFTISLVFSTLP